MAKPKWHTTWTVLPHRPPRQLEDNLMVVEGRLGDTPMDRRMTVVRLNDGRLVIHNGICLEEDAMRRLETWGTPAFLVVPNGFHRMDALVFKQRYPDVKVIAGPKGRKAIARALPIDGGVELLPAGGGMRGEDLAGDKLGEMAFVIEHGGAPAKATLLVNDALFNMAHQPGLQGFVIKLLGSTGGLKVTRIMRWLGVSDTRAFKAHLGRLASTPGLVRLVMSHGDVLEGDDVAARIAAAVS